MKNKKIALFSTLCGIVAMTATFGGITAMKGKTPTAAAKTAEIVAGQIEEKYAYGTSFSLPDSVQIKYGDAQYSANKGYIVYPDGMAYSGTEAYTLDKLGKYRVVYETTVGGKTVSAEREFTITTGVYSIEDTSILSYETLRAFSVYKHLTAEEKAEGLRMGEIEKDVKGLKILFESGNTFTYTKPVNIYENNYNDIIAFNAVHLNTEVKSWTVRLTDCYNPEIYVDFSFSKKARDETYVRMSCNGQASIGLRESATSVGDAYIDEKAYNRDNNGTPVTGNRSLDVVASLPQDRYNNITLALDTTDRKAIKAYVKNVSSRGEEPNNRLIAQLNNDQVFPYGFEGFTNGDVYISLVAKDFNGVQQGHFEIASIMGVSGEGLIPTEYKDEIAPEINVDAPEGELQIVAGAPIPVPTATARDASGLAGEVDYVVWYGYDTDSKRMLHVKDNQFTPMYLGKYTVEYFAYDIYGNKAIKCLDMLAVKEGSEAIVFNCNNVSNASAGEYVRFDDFEIDSLTAIKELKMTLTCPDGETVEIADLSVPYLLTSTGEYTVKYTYCDSFYADEYVYTFTAADAGTYAFDGGIIAPKYFIKGASYTLDKTKLYQYSGVKPTEAELKTYIKYDSGSYTEIDVKKLTVTGNKKAKLKYVCVNDTQVFIESEEISIVDVGYNTAEYDKSKYFVGSFVASTSKEESDRTMYTYKFTSSAKPELDFINVLPLSSFAFKFAIPEGQKTKGVSLELTDYYDCNQKAVLTIAQDNSGTIFSYNDGEPVKLTSSLVGAPIEVAYDGAGTVTVGSVKISCPISFTSDLCLLKVKISGLTHGDRFDVFSICNQPFGYYVRSDTGRPILSAEKPEQVAKIGDVISVAKPTFVDVLSPNTIDNCFLSVYKNGQAIESTAGVLLKDVGALDTDYAFKINGYGSYLIVYEYVDGAGKKCDLRYTVTATDNESPILTLNNYNGKTVKVTVGVETPILAHTVSDNYTAVEKLEVWAFVYNAKGVCVSAQKDAFTVLDAGEYTVQVYCIDEAGNMASATYKIKAE